MAEPDDGSSEALAPLGPASPHFIAALDELRETARLGPVLDLACGRGRHALQAAAAGLRVIGLDRNRGFLDELGERARTLGQPVHRILCDLEADNPISIKPGSCGAILVYRFLYRPLCPLIETLLAPGGLLLYETFTLAQRELGSGPRNPRFLLEPGELPRLFPRLRIELYEELITDPPRPNAIAHIVARHP